jgi:hypothetical protein
VYGCGFFLYSARSAVNILFFVFYQGWKGKGGKVEEKVE